MRAFYACCMQDFFNMSNSSPISHLTDFNPSIIIFLLPLYHSRLSFSLLHGKKKSQKTPSLKSGGEEVISMISEKKKPSKVFEADGIYRAKVVMGHDWGIFGEHFLVGSMTASENIALP